MLSIEQTVINAKNAKITTIYILMGKLPLALKIIMRSQIVLFKELKIKKPLAICAKKVTLEDRMMGVVLITLFNLAIVKWLKMASA